MTLKQFFFFFNLSVITRDALFLNASLINKFPSLFFPLIAKKISFLLISFELIDALPISNFEEILFELFNSFKIFNLKLLEIVLFFIIRRFFFSLYLKIKQLLV